MLHQLENITKDIALKKEQNGNSVFKEYNKWNEKFPVSQQ